MKPDSTDTAASATGPEQPRMWRGLDELAGVPGYEEATLDEFPEGAAEFADEPSRRRFLTLMGASLALAGAAGCNLRPASQRKIVPYTTQPDEVTPGVPTFYASAAPVCGYGQGVLVRSNEGRPTKVEGNPDHPASLGGAGIHALASVLDLYDPDRSRSVTHRGEPSSYELASAALRGKLFTETTPNAGVRLRVLTETVTSPTLAAQLTQLFTLFPSAKWVRFDAVGGENAREGIARAFGRPASVHYDFNKADVVVALDSDFLSAGPGAVRYNRDFADRRKIRKDGKTRAEIDAGRQPNQPFKDGVKFDPGAELKDALLNRLYVVETMPTITGGIADHRLPLTNAQVESFVRALAAAVGVQGVSAGAELPKEAQDWIKPLADDLGEKKGKCVVVAGEHLSPAAQALAHAMNVTLGNVGSTVRVTAPVEAGLPEKMVNQMSDLPTLVAELNAKAVDVLLVLGGANPAYSAPADVDFAGTLQKMADEKAQLARKAAEGGRNSLNADEQKSLDYLNNFFSFHLGSHQDETAVLCEWHVPEAHYLETWGDIRGHDGTVAIQQPLIAPLHGGRSAIEVVATLLRTGESGVPAAPRDPLDIVRTTWRNWFNGQKKGGSFDVFWQESVRKGVVDGTAFAADAKASLAANFSADGPKGGTPAPAAPAQGDYEINFRADPTLLDGRYANNGWLQELPKPLTKISWDNAAFMSRNTANKLGVEAKGRWTGGEHGRYEVNVVEIEVRGKKVKAPVWILPGHADGAITVHLGHGRTRAGQHVGNIEGSANLNVDGQRVRGFNAYPIRFSGGLWNTPGKVSRVGGGPNLGGGQKYFLACTQGHWAMAEKDPQSGKPLNRKPVRFAELTEYRRNPLFAKIPPTAIGETELINENVPLPAKHGEKHDGHDHDGRLMPLNMYNPEPTKALAPDLRPTQWRRWAMAIDLSACTGCSACMVACQGENNLPVVGKEQVTKGREMYWINIDRYYGGFQNEPDAVRAYFQPRLCVQCENAPCEVVCPVGATVHSADGLNDMTYNRCVGTRYCSNNCPYKVRRFNFLTFNDVYTWDTDTIKLGRNPDVSVRSRGVMEKCTFCVQRIRGAEIVAEREQRSIRDGEIMTACQAACPSGAIVFGDINQADAVVSKWKDEPHNYGLLAELNTRPRLTYLATVRNPNPAMPKA